MRITGFRKSYSLQLLLFLAINQLCIYCRVSTLNNGQRGEVYDVNGDQAAVILDDNVEKANENEAENPNNDRPKASVYWINGTFFFFKILKSLIS